MKRAAYALGAFFCAALLGAQPTTVTPRQSAFGWRGYREAVATLAALPAGTYVGEVRPVYGSELRTLAMWTGSAWIDVIGAGSVGSSASTAGSGTELQYRVGASTFGAVTASAVSGANITLGGTLSGITQLTADNLRLDGNVISTTSGDAIVSPASGLTVMNDTSFRIVLSGTPVFQVSFNGTFVAIRDIGKITWSPDGNVTTAGDTAIERDGVAGRVKLTSQLRLVPSSSPGTCDGSMSGVEYVTIADNSKCYCNGVLWTATPITGSCN